MTSAMRVGRDDFFSHETRNHTHFCGKSTRTTDKRKLNGVDGRVSNEMDFAAV
jgi:hypothetical protein